MSEYEIIKICEQYKIKNYTINNDMSIDVNGDVDLSSKNLINLPLNFGRVSGYFSCSDNNLTTLKGCPSYVGNGFYCSKNKLTTLKHCPSYVGGDFWCVNNNKLTSLRDLPMNFYVGGSIFVHFNDIKSAAEYGKLFFGTVVGTINMGNEKMNEFLNKHKNPPKKDLPRLLSELRKITL